MCGLVGLYLNDNINLEERFFTSILNNMTNVLQHRGPDNKGIYFNKEDKLGLGFQRLSILDLKSSANQPMLSKNKDWVMVFNGEIYNFQILKENLKRKKAYWRSSSDSEVVIEYIAEYGFYNSIKKFNGMFAIAAYCLSEKTLWLARDKFGEKPLYYNFSSNQGLCFASELRALSDLPGFKTIVCEEALSQYIRYGYVPEPLSIYKNTYKLEPGHIIRYDKKNFIVKKKYWDSITSYIKVKAKGFKGTFEEAKEKVKNQIDKSTRERLVSDVPLGVFLSGGIDSSNLALSLNRQNITPNTFSIGFYDKKTNELNFANEVAKVLKTNHSYKYIKEQECIDNIESIVDAYDEPFSDPSQIPTYMLCKFAKKKITVAISGEGADELFGGYPRYINIANFWNKIKNQPELFSELMELLSNSFSSSKYLHLKSIGKKFRKYSHINLDSLYKDEMSRWRPDEKILEKNFFKNSFFEKNINNKDKIFSTFRLLMMRDIITYLPSNLLVKTDRASMSNSLEIRSPFLDNDLVNLIWSLPDNYIFHKTEKVILKEILKEKLGHDFVNRKKQGFEPPLYKWLKGSLNQWAKDLLLSSNSHFEQSDIKKLILRFEKGEKKLTYKIWTIIMFMSWKNKYC
ncbi:MAG: asparagine synthase (glutamine-hydrolyzing) [Pelagibacterales bacterium]|nr:asparagine synthase (glutamine-hydrolyzing) [Pelagibacterales bacterium]OUU63223.1 MAG: asparagine synthase (glutamine-hydrolyzing) [Alphaproteobacteria bacterium TMED62]|tara:strand:- start:27962 stop:29845 length:1884 start_codon:yes stop_codon:yes gene_type:complete